MPLLELKLLEIHSFPHFSLTCFDILSWNFAYDFVLLYYRSSSSVVNLRQFLWELCPFWNLNYLQFSALFSYMLWHIELKFCTWLCSNVLQIKFECRQFVLELCPFWNLEYCKYTVFRTFLLHALTYWVEILHMALFYCTTDQLRVSSIFVGVMPLLELRILKIYSFPHFSLTCSDLLSWKFAYGFVLLK